MKLSTHLHLVPRVRVSGAIDVPLLPHMSVWRAQGQLHYIRIIVVVVVYFTTTEECVVL